MTKFNAAWQLVRVKAKKETGVPNKLKMVMDYFNKNSTVEDKERVLNWARMLKHAYSRQDAIKKEIDKTILKIQKTQVTRQDNISKIYDLNKDEIKMILSDLKKRKYNFQFNKTPQDHIDFVKKLEEALKAKE